jgi:UDP-N-acetylmuramoyl-tripeptide--D-alanyl-D-alanine ligase
MDQSIEQVYAKFIKGHPICTDSRNITENSIFFALKGDTFDGNKFAEKALDNGAVLAIVDNAKFARNSKTILVSNVLDFLQELARYHRNQLEIPFIGLTGSNGKTTTKELINRVLSCKFKTFATKGNLNNHIGVPLSVLSVDNDIQIALIEMGANHIGEIAQLCSIAQPTHGLITNIGKAHLEGFGSFEGVKQAKSELYKFLSNQKGFLFINSNNEILAHIASQYKFAQQKSYGYDTYQVSNIVSSKTFLSFNLEIEKAKHKVNTQLVGQYNIENILAAICIGQHFGIEPEQAIAAIENYTPDNSRSQIVKTGNNEVILDAYNANPTSMEQAILNFKNLQTNSPKVAILGDMLELGEYAATEHQHIAKLALNSIKQVVFIGDNFKQFSNQGLWFANHLDFSTYLMDNPIQGKTILLKGSRGIKLDELIKQL